MNNTSRQFINLFVTLAVILGLVACAAPAAPTPAPAVSEATAAPEPAKAVGMEVCKGQNLTLASMTDQYVAAFRVLVPKFAAASGATITLDELGYVDLYQKLIVTTQPVS